MKHEIISYAGWDHCLRLFNHEIEMIITTEVGPRVIRFGFIGGKNEFVEYPEQLGKKGDAIYRSYGGHRFWVAPEEKARTYYPDNNPVEWLFDGDSLKLKSPVETTTGFRKEIEIYLSENENKARVNHRLTNCGKEPVEASIWALSVMAPGGTAIIPQEPYVPHPEKLLPVRPLVLWSYTDMNDPRYRWGRKLIRLRQDANAASPQKIGGLVTNGWCAFQNGENVFIKTIPYQEGETYPDFGCNAEFFTNKKMLELETLSPLKMLEPGNSIRHEEHWTLLQGITMRDSDEEMENIINGARKVDLP